MAKRPAPRSRESADASPPAERRKRIRPKSGDGSQNEAQQAPIVTDSGTRSVATFAPTDEHADDFPTAPLEATKSTATTEPSQEDIRARAYQRFVDRGSSHGADFDDWVAAERELRKR
jgi:hypothetical protein